MTGKVDVQKNRVAKKYSRSKMAARCLWIVGSVFFWIIPRPFFGLRRGLLKLFGANIGKNVHVYATAKIYFPWNLSVGDDSAIGEHALIYNLGPLVIGKRVTVSQRAHLCGGSHDYTDATMPLLKTPIHIGDDAWICADAFIGPGVTIGEGTVVGARAVATKDVEPWVVVAGNPAVLVKRRTLVTRQV